MRNLIVIALAGALCAGCSATASTWKRAGGSAAQVDADLRICEYEAELGLGQGQETHVYGGGMGAAIGAGIGDGIANGLRIARLRSLCMQARGYRQG
jgi:hypothetical protein